MAFYRHFGSYPLYCFCVRPKIVDRSFSRSVFTKAIALSNTQAFPSTPIRINLLGVKCPISNLKFCGTLLTSDGTIKSSLSRNQYFTTSCKLLYKTEPQNPNILSKGMDKGKKSTLYYIMALGVVALGLSYAAVPLYRIFCQAYSYGGTTQQILDSEKIEAMEKVEGRVITVRFNADTAASMTWNFRPQQREIKVLPGETALAFYTARNPTDRPVIGVSTYNVIPFDAGQYFNKIQCFCFEEQILNPHEEVHMPVFFYIDPEFVDDPKMENTDLLTLSYTFFEAREGVPIPLPNFTRN